MSSRHYFINTYAFWINIGDATEVNNNHRHRNNDDHNNYIHYLLEDILFTFRF